MKKGIGPQGLGASKSPAKMYGTKSPAKQVGRNLAEVADKKRVKADRAEAKGKPKKAERLRNKASKLDKKHVTKAFKNIDLNFKA
jgi:hypothetical protein